MVFRWPIEIDGLPNLHMVIFHGKPLNNQMVHFLLGGLEHHWMTFSNNYGL